MTALSEIWDRLQVGLSHAERNELSRSDALALGELDGRPTYVVVEASSKADRNDVLRVFRWAQLLRKAGLEAVPLVACKIVSDKTRAFAHQQGVRLIVRDRMVDAPAA